jgi:hypothetical protein
MFEAIANLDLAIFTKTDTGRLEVQSRGLNLDLMTRRLLILVDGKRRVAEIGPLVPGQDVVAMLRRLFELRCIELLDAGQAKAAAAPAPAAAPDAAGNSGGADAFLASLPDPSARTPQDVEKARNVMTNTVNTVFQPNTRLTLLKAIQACQTPQDARGVYAHWRETIESSSIGKKRLPEFQKMLAKVL